jgi:protein arginine N-methyltransferase 1
LSGSPTTYSVNGYGEMIADRIRMDAYVEALRRSVGPQSVVLDLGAGTGIMALVAAKLGARRVYAVEPSAALQLGREAARVNGLAGRIEFLEMLASEVTLPEPANVLISDLRSSLPLYQRHVPSIADARRRLLVSGATIIPREDSLWAAIVEAHDVHEALLRPWSRDGYGVDLSAGRSVATSTPRAVRLEAEQLLSRPLAWETLDYRTREQTDAKAEIHFEIVRSGAGHGIVLWFDSVLTEGVSITNAPGAAKLIYGQVLLPWPEAVSLKRGDEIAISLRAGLVRHDYAWRWATRIERRGRLLTTFEQSTLGGAPLSLNSLRKRREAHVPVLTEDGAIDRDILNQIDGRRTLGEVAHLLVERHPGRFPDWKDALRRASELSARYR